MTLPFAATPAERRLLTEGRLSGPMPWVIAIMMFLTVLAAAGGLALNHAASNVTGSIAQRITVQIVEANPDIREQQTRAAMAALQAMDGVNEVIRVPDSEIDALMEPWIGAAGQEEGIPVPTMIDADLNAETHADLESVEEAILAVAPAARVDDHAQFPSTARRIDRLVDLARPRFGAADGKCACGVRDPRCSRGSQHAPRHD